MMTDLICEICKKEYKGRSDSRFCSMACKSKYHRNKRKQDVIYLAKKVQAQNKAGNSIAEKYLPDEKKKEE